MKVFPQYSEEGSRPARFYVMADMGMSNDAERLSLVLDYDIESQGDSLAELIDNAVVCEINCDGTTMRSRGLYDYSDAIVRRGEALLAQEFLKGGNK